MIARITIICFLTLLSGCSLLRLSYDHGPRLTWWWIDSYVGFNNEQIPLAKQAIHEWFDWHRSSQLPHYADWLAVVREHMDSAVTSAQICQWSDELQKLIAPAIDQAVQLSTPLIMNLNKAQWDNLERGFAKSNDELRKNFLQPDLNDRYKASVKRAVKRIKNLYGDITETQQQLIDTSIKTSPFNPELWLAERQRRQGITLQILNQLTIGLISDDQTASVLRSIIEYTVRSDDPNYRAYQVEMTEYTCDVIARMHNSANKIQRQHVHDKLKNWEIDLRVLFEENHRNISIETR